MKDFEVRPFRALLAFASVVAVLGLGRASSPLQPDGSARALQLTQYDRESMSERERNLERPGRHQAEVELGDQRQRKLEGADRDRFEEPDERQRNIELGDERQRELEGRE